MLPAFLCVGVQARVSEVELFWRHRAEKLTALARLFKTTYQRLQYWKKKLLEMIPRARSLLCDALREAWDKRKRGVFSKVREFLWKKEKLFGPFRILPIDRQKKVTDKLSHKDFA